LCTRADRIQKDLSDTHIKQHYIRVSQLWNEQFTHSYQFTAGMALWNTDQSDQTQISVEMNMLFQPTGFGAFALFMVSAFPVSWY